jgi:4-alpha-glucanotransferase
VSARRQAGVVAPLFSIRTSAGWGLGEIPDLARFAEWAAGAGFSVVQVLPVGEASRADASPYSAASAFALDPVYLSLDACEDFRATGGRDALSPEQKDRLARVAAAPGVDWATVRGLKAEALRLAFERFRREEWEKNTARAGELRGYLEAERSWLDDHALYKIWHEQTGKSWLDWPSEARERDPAAIERLRREQADPLLRVAWTQWQLDLQWREARRAATALGVAFMGDTPFVVGVDSSDVWAHRELFRIDRRVGTPPEEGAPDGQDWGLPAYDWEVLGREGYSWIHRRAARAGEHFSLHRIDHAMGYYRTYFRSADGRERGFTPPDEPAQIKLGETLMRLLGHRAEVVAEDLGRVPPFLRPSLERLGVPGYRVLRWEKDGDVYRAPSSWPECSVATNGTHDTETTATWFEALDGAARDRLRKVPGLEEVSTGAFDDRTRDAFLRALYQAPSRMVLVMIQDAFGARERINTPGGKDGGSWTFRMARSVDELLADRATMERLARLAAETGRSVVR